MLYLNAGDLASLGLAFEDMFEPIAGAFRERARDAVVMPSMVWFPRRPQQWFHLVMSWIPSLKYAAAKFQSGDFTKTRTLPSVKGLVVLCDDATGDIVAIMDAGWITGMRTAAASALVAREQARRDSSTLAIFGCGLQARTHLPAFKAAVPGLERVRIFDRKPEGMADYIAEMGGRHGVEIVAAHNVEELVRDADIVLSSATIMERDRRPVIHADWLKPGSLTVTIDWDSWITDDAIRAMDIVMTDDRTQFDGKRSAIGVFPAVDRIDADLGELLLSGKARRTRDDQRIMAFMLGVAIEDLATGVVLFERARTRGVGTWLPL